MKTYAEIQAEVRVWSQRNFQNAVPEHSWLGMLEELGELSHAILKRQQGIREYNPPGLTTT